MRTGCTESSLGTHSFCWFCHVAADNVYKMDREITTPKRWKRQVTEAINCFLYLHICRYIKVSHLTILNFFNGARGRI